MAYFYDKDQKETFRWEEIGGFNTFLLMEIRNAMLDVKSDDHPRSDLQVVVAEWIKHHPMYDFPDDEIG